MILMENILDWVLTTWRTHHYNAITWKLQCLKSPAIWLFTPQFVQGDIIVHVTGLSWGDSPVDYFTKGQQHRKRFHAIIMFCFSVENELLLNFPYIMPITELDEQLLSMSSSRFTNWISCNIKSYRVITSREVPSVVFTQTAIAAGACSHWPISLTRLNFNPSVSK